MSILALIIEIQLITMSGALAPGPLSIASIYHGTSTGKFSGLKIALGHTIVEFPLYILIGFGLIKLIWFSGVTAYLSIIGGIALLYFTIPLFKYQHSSNLSAANKGIYARPILTGIILSGLNPYFIIWWLTVGAKLILDIIEVLGYGLYTLIYVLHVWMDYAWLLILSYLGYSSLKALSSKYIKIISIILGILMLYFAFNFIIDGIRALLS